MSVMARDTPPSPMMFETTEIRRVGSGGGGDGKGPQTWQVIGGFLGSAAVIVVGTWTIAMTVFVTKETYLKDQATQAALQAEMAAQLNQNKQVSKDLKEAVEKLTTKMEEEPDPPQRRRRRRSRPE